MIGVLVVAHQELAEALLNTTQFIVGDFPQVAAISIDVNQEMHEMRQRMEAALKEVDQGDGVLILTDMFGGTPANIALSFHQPGRAEVLTGVNLPMLIKLATCRHENRPLAELAKMIREYGQKNITAASEILAGRHRGDKDFPPPDC